jgi:serine/threonine protein kinase
MEGYSQVGRTTCDSRGTTGYRAPEIIVEKNEFEKAKFSKKSDIWALGCLIYESVFLEHAFSSDISIKHFSISGKPLSVPYALDVNGLQRDSLSYILQSTLHFNPKKRISAEDARSFCSVQSNSDVIKIRHTCPEPRYLYAVRCLPLAPAYPGFEEDVTFLIDNTTIVTDEPSLTDLNRGIRVIVTTITSRSPSQIADLCEQFTNRCGRNLAAWLASNLDSHIPAVEIFPIVALASSPLDLDLYILEKFRMKRSGAWDDLLVDLCVGRNENDLKRLAFEYLQRYEKLPREAWLAKASNDLKPALEIILEVFFISLTMTNASLIDLRLMSRSTISR